MSIDENLYSRQIAAFGTNAMNKIAKLKILIYGLRGLGIEISKNIALSGPEKVAIYDNNNITIDDLGANFYIEEKDIGFRRDEICIKKLSELNHNVKFNILKNGNIEYYIQEYDILIITEIMDIKELIKLNDLCHINKKGFIYCLVFGLSFFCFNDFGEHVITNLNNNDIKKYFIKDIIKGKKTVITIDNELENFELYEDEYIKFKDIKGMKQLLDGNKRKILNSKIDKFEIDEDSSNYDEYIEGGIVEEVRENIYIKNKRFEEMINFPMLCEKNINSENNELNLHLAFLSLHEYFKINKKLPDNKQDDLNNILNITKKIYEKYKNDWCKNINLNEQLLDSIYKYSKCQISPICGYGGGVASQEIIKYIGIYKPINQWFRVQFTPILDNSISHNSTILDSRYKDQILIFGDETQKKLENLNVFLIGTGAVGCELLKYFAMMGISTNENSLLTATDHDRIEKSNLNRQFLFRENDITSLKSKCAIEAIKKMNNKINCKYMEEYVCKETEIIFNKEFFEKQNAVIIAVDNFEARNYISQQCEKYKLPYFNCGTDGPYANVEAFIPGKTVEASYPINYKKVVPDCTLKMFPSSINHCILWTLNHFEKYFNNNIKKAQLMYNNINKFYESMNEYLDLRIQFKKIKNIFKILRLANSKNFDNCIKFSIKKYYNFFIYKINDVLSCYPVDKINQETGLKFWTGNKRMPHPLKFDINDIMCFEFIKSFSCLLSKCLCINIENIKINDYIKEYCNNYHIKNRKKKIYENKKYYENKIIIIKDKINIFLKGNTNNIKFIEIPYEKDSIDINQINFISCCSNLRAKNYNIEQLDKLKIKIIAGKIIPALITSTSSIAGLLALQIYVICQNSNCRTFRIGIMDLSDNTLGLGIPELKK